MNLLFRAVTPAIVLIASFTPAAMSAESARYELTVEAGNRNRQNVPVRGDLAVPRVHKNITQASIKGPDGLNLVGQITGPSLLSEPITVEQADVHRQLCFMLDKLEAGKTLRLEVTIPAPRSAA